jgi:hypothetical protein
MKDDFRKIMLQRIAENIEAHGVHVYGISGGESPRYFYTIGLKEKVGGEIVLPGLAHMPGGEAHKLINDVAHQLRSGTPVDEINLKTKGFGSFILTAVDPSWSKRMLLGALDYYDCSTLPAWQIRPVEEEHTTIDVPDMRQAFDPEKNPVWQWLDGGWPYSVPVDTLAVTNLDALLGYAVSELMRWEPEDWEIFSGPGHQLSQDELFLVPISTLVAYDPSLVPALSIPVGTGLYREFDEEGNARLWDIWVPAPSAN